LAPIYLALLGLAALSMMAFGVALLPRDLAASEPTPVSVSAPGNDAVPGAGRPREGAVRRPPDAPSPRPSHWM
jgi:hypothetical protein